MRTLKVKHIAKACKKYNYILLRTTNNHVIGFNCKGINLVFKVNKNINSETATNIIGYKEISFEYYIQIKVPFLIQNKTKQND